MRLQFKTEGGFAYLPGLNQPVTIDTDGLPPEEAGKLINWWVNSPECANINLAERGVPANTEILAAIKPKLSPDQAKVAKFIEDIKPELADTPIAPPPGGGKINDTLQRHQTDVLFGRSSSADAAKKFVDEAKSNLKS